MAAGAALAAIFVVTIVWWSLALWPVPGEVPAWLAKTRAACFGAAPNGLPNAAGWLLLIAEPVTMVVTLFVIAGVAARRALRSLADAPAGRVALATAIAVLLLGAGASAARVHRVAFASPPPELALTKTGHQSLSRPAPALGLVDQRGAVLTLADLRGRPTLVTFAFAHCETVCPLVVRDALGARDLLGDEAPRLVVVTLDPWRDTPSRLGYAADRWGLTRPDEHALSGPVQDVTSALDRWGVSRARDRSTGQITHPPLVYVVDSAGIIRYSAVGGPETLAALVRSL